MASVEPMDASAHTLDYGNLHNVTKAPRNSIPLWVGPLEFPK
jgi:hypothetical protein